MTPLEALSNSDWPMSRLKHLAAIQTGVTLGGEGDSSLPSWPYLRVANVQAGFVDLSHITNVHLSPERAALSTLRDGDVLMTEGGDIDKLGRGALWRGEVSPMLHQNHIFAVRAGSRLSPEFLVYWLDAPLARSYFRTTARQTTNLAATNKWTLGNLPVPAPPLDVQDSVVAMLNQETAKTDALIAEAQGLVAVAKERRSALIAAAVSGQIDVRGEAG